MKATGSFLLLVSVGIFGATATGRGGDWPMWRFDPGRTACTPDPVPEDLHLLWIRHLPPLEPAFKTHRLHFDAGYEPVVLGRTLFVGSSRNDSVTAIDTETGGELWRFFAEGPIRRVGVNFGAPGDRRTRGGTLWLEHPDAGGASPRVPVRVEPSEVRYFYHHSLWVDGGTGWPWVSASGALGARSVRVEGLERAEFRLRLYFIEPEDARPGARVFDVEVQGAKAISGLDVAKESGGSMRSLVKELSNVRVDGAFELRFEPSAGVPVISGVELVREGLPLDEIPRLERRRTREQLLR